MIDTTGKLCPKCQFGYMHEASQFDDYDGVLTCTYCKIRLPRWVNKCQE